MIITSNNASSKTKQSTDGSNNISNSSYNVSSAKAMGTSHEFLNTSSSFLSMLSENSEGHAFLNDFSDKVNRYEMDDSSTSKEKEIRFD